ncbi:hypothetical protein [Zhongshania sp. BJYM1]|uniref:hypothetical protein n=1 Tax=Zhongshania aquatica TaxID=2965069 RepID=UPI0022B4BCF9|nr:hypothetical protein [Marortus sp. BJYM1]
MKPKVIGSIFFCFASLVGCGGSSSDSSDVNGITSNGGATCDPVATTTDRYLATSYESCNVSRNSLVGLWMIVSDYQIDNGNVFRDKQQRVVMSITESADGLNAFVCNRTPEFRNFRFSSADSILDIYDDYAEASVELSIESNVLMKGAHYGEGFVSVDRSSVTAVKISNSVALAKLNLDYTMDGYSFSEDDIPISCFSQVKGKTDIKNPDINFDADYIYFFADVNNNGFNEEVFISIGVPAIRETGPDFDLDFVTSNQFFDSEDAENTIISYSANSNDKIYLRVDSVDDFEPNDSASLIFTFDID